MQQMVPTPVALRRVVSWVPTPFVTLHSRGSATKGEKIRSGCLIPTFSGAQKRAEMLCFTLFFSTLVCVAMHVKYAVNVGITPREGGARQGGPLGLKNFFLVRTTLKDPHYGIFSRSRARAIFEPLFEDPREHRGYVALPPT